MKVSFKSLYKISYTDRNKLNKEQYTRFALETMTMYDKLPHSESLKYDGVCQKIYDKDDKAYEEVCKKYGLTAQKVVDNNDFIPKVKDTYGPSPKSLGFYGVILNLKAGKVTDIDEDKFDRPVITVDDRYNVIQQKDGGKIIKNSAITLFADKNNKITRAITPLKEFIYFPNGNSLDIELKNGKRTGNYIFYSKEYPEGLEVESYGEDKNGSKLSKIIFNPFESVNYISDGKKAVKYDVEDDAIEKMDGINRSAKTYTPELLRVIATGKV